MQNSSPHQPADLSPAQLLARVEPMRRALLAAAAAVAAGQGSTLWLVGGAVRDLLRDLPLGRDLDLVVEGDALAFASALAAALAGRVTAQHAPFGTATLEAAFAGAPIVLDLASARSEHYPRPGALPIVERASIDVDLARRDFSINAIALRLHDNAGTLHVGPLLDPFDGRDDLAAGLLRILHPVSFSDDPTRMLRGLRLAARYSLALEPDSRAALAIALATQALATLSPERIQAELCLALAEPRPAEVLRLAQDWGIASQIWPTLRWSAALAARCVRFANAFAQGTGVAEIRHEMPLVFAGLLLYDLAPDERARFAAHYRLSGEATLVLRDLGRLQPALKLLAPGLALSEVDRILRSFYLVSMYVVHYAEVEPLSTIVGRYLAELRQLAPHLDGRDLQRLGLPRGPQIGRMLAELRAAHLDGLVASRSDEERLVQTRWAEWQADDA